MHDGVHGLHALEDTAAKAAAARTLRLETMIEARKVIDAAEGVCPEDLWTLATCACPRRVRPDLAAACSLLCGTGHLCVNSSCFAPFTRVALQTRSSSSLTATRTAGTRRGRPGATTNASELDRERPT